MNHKFKRTFLIIVSLTWFRNSVKHRKLWILPINVRKINEPYSSIKSYKWSEKPSVVLMMTRSVIENQMVDSNTCLTFFLSLLVFVVYTPLSYFPCPCVWESFVIILCWKIFEYEIVSCQQITEFPVSIYYIKYFWLMTIFHSLFDEMTNSYHLSFKSQNLHFLLQFMTAFSFDLLKL